MSNDLNWQRLSVLRPQMEANCTALSAREPDLARRVREFAPVGECVLAIRGNDVIIGQLAGTTVHVRPCLLSAAAAQETLRRVYPGGACTEPLLVAGVDQGWLWEQAYRMPVSSPAVPGYRPPLYFLVKEIEELWIALHLHDWRTMLADGRVRLMAGDNVVEQLRLALLNDPQVPEPKVALTLGPSIWPSGSDLDSIVAGTRATLSAEFRESMARYPAIYSWATPGTVAEKLRSGERLRVLGMTSRYTTFLQYSMRDWLAAFERLGHETRLVIENDSYEMHNSLTTARVCCEFRPDLIVMIDHCRGEYNAMPGQIPFVMWVQDQLPNIFSERGGAMQGSMDFCLGFGRLHLSGRYGYPARRYMPSTMGVNEERFGNGPPTPAQLERFACDVSYVSHASTPADELLKGQLERQAADGKRFFVDVYERMVAHYEGGGAALSDVAIRLLIEQSLAATKVSIPESDLKPLLTFLNGQLSNALFRHQTLIWLSELGVNLHIYGRGWEKHPKLARHAKGIADNITDLGAIYRASKINIQVTPHGAVHQRLLDGLAAGGFFLLRYHGGDAVGPIYQALWDWCERNGITNNEQLYARADERIVEMIDGINQMEGSPDDRREMSVFDVMNGHRDNDFMTSAASIWPEYELVAFDTREELEAKVKHFLADEGARRAVAASMRAAMVERASYLSITRRLMKFIADELTPAAALAA